MQKHENQWEKMDIDLIWSKKKAIQQISTYFKDKANLRLF